MESKTIKKLRWTKYENDFIILNYKKMKYEDIARHLINRTPKAINFHIKYLREKKKLDAVKDKKKNMWTISEEKILLKNIRNNPMNLQEVFRKTAKQLNKNSRGVEKHWYAVLRHKTTDPVFALISEKQTIQNTKTVLKNKPISMDKITFTSLSLWEKIKLLFLK